VVAFHDLKMSYRSRKAGHVVVDDDTRFVGVERVGVGDGDSDEVERFVGVGDSDDDVERLTALKKPAPSGRFVSILMVFCLPFPPVKEGDGAVTNDVGTRARRGRERAGGGDADERRRGRHRPLFPFDLPLALARKAKAKKG
jgi:hypothetical protein